MSLDVCQCVSILQVITVIVYQYSDDVASAGRSRPGECHTLLGEHVLSNLLRHFTNHWLIITQVMPLRLVEGMQQTMTGQCIRCPHTRSGR